MFSWLCDLVSRSVIVAIAVVLIVAVGGGLYYFSSQIPASPTTTPETKTSTPEVKKETTTPETKETPTTPEPKKETPPTMVDGAALYKENCEGCHGARGVGGTALALSASNADRSITENGNIEKGMPAYKDKLTPEEITAIIDYLKS
jgi:mono/diheme cytochrome c family protein